MTHSMTQWLGVGLLVALLAGSSPALAQGAVHAVSAPHKAMAGGFSPAAPGVTNNGTSNADAGYWITSTPGTVSDVKAVWNVPQLAAKCPATRQMSSFSVEISGINQSTAQQIGTETDCAGSTITYYAWYDFYPATPVKISMTISPTDTMHAEVRYSPTTHKFTLSISDAKTGKSFSIAKAVSKAQRAYAEWNVEASGHASNIPLTDFGWVVFKNASTTIAGGTGSIGAFTNVRFTMWNNAGTAKMAIPLSLANGGATFRVNWISAGP